ncbi:site-specific DNA-methyltransferase [Spongiactinospora rosea]|uniref:Site-specific DNA-methyltransferase n=1 Tax=Spongiactinospora rosea TaxID=2248750 RepID=A0A366LFS5_9ACTN|nr:site-specific DNA-methyltransferase [Spongiactinospora rosea]RBQ12124.1 site-specific DNA-methyltransferase [Spongiactinospora rosea]
MASGRLALSWVGRDESLLNTADGGYEWVSRQDPRVTEIRLLREIGKTGEVTGTSSDNLLIQGDNYSALQALTRTPEYSREYRGKVKLVYIDPPFNTGQAFEHYDDSLEHSVWLTMMRDRLLLIRELLAPGGSVWVHLDDAEMAYCRVLMDEIFGRGNFVGTIVWQKIHARNNSAQHLSTVHDYLLVYARSKSDLVLNRIDRTELSDQEFWNPDDDPRGPWRRSDLTASHAYEDGRYEVIGPHGDAFSPRGNRWWSCSQATFEALREDNRLWWGKTGRTFPFRKRFQSELGGLVPTTFWTHDEVGDNRQAKGEVTRLFDRSRIFSTPKPEALLKRVIEIASDRGDVVVDVFAGSGTTPAVAHKMGRRWIAAELSTGTMETFTRPRLEKVVSGDDPGGVTKAVGWAGGGGFRSMHVAPSAFEIAKNRVFLAEWARGEDLVAVVAAQLGFTCDGMEVGPFCGRRGRARLAVIDGVVDEVVARGVLGHLDEGERVVLVGRGVTPEAESLVSELSRGSRVLKAPRDLVRRERAVR